LKYLANIGTHRRNKDWEHFLIWNEFETEAQPEDKKKSSSRKSSTPRSGKIKRRAISPLEVEQTSSSSKPKRDKKKLDFSKATKGETSSVDKKILNLPYTNSEDEEEKEVKVDHEEVVTEKSPSDAALEGDQMKDIEAPGSPTPKEDQELQIVEASTSKP
jgi:hypothetical protein